MTIPPDPDPLFDPQLPQDAELQQLQASLAPYAARARGLHLHPPLPAATQAAAVPRQTWLPWWRPLLAGATGLVLLLWAGLAYRLSWSEGRPWTVHNPYPPAGLATPATTLLKPGAWLHTGTGESLRVQVARIGRLLLSAGSSMELLQTGGGQHRVELRQGHLHARIWAPPGYFGVRSGMVEVVDLGCEFELWRQPDGSGRVLVHSGWIAWRQGDDEVLVPAGYQLEFHTDRRGTPQRPQPDPAFSDALQTLELALANPSALPAAAAQLALQSQDADAYTLLHLLSQHPQLAGTELYPRLAKALRTPADQAHRHAWQRGELQAMNRWWQLLPTSPKHWWHNWADAFDW